MQIDIKKVTKQYKKKTALKDVSLELKPGVYGFLGPNGAGKSTLMNILAGVLKTTKGEILLDGKNILSLGREYRDMLGYLPQTGGYYKNFTGEEFLTYMAILKGMKNKKEIHEKVKEVLQRTNLTDAAKRKVGQYSGGMRQRLGIAQVLLNNPKILILDEPTVGLDPKERIRFRNLFSEISKDCIVLLATHIVSDVAYIADNIILIKNGEVIMTGNTEECVGKIADKVYEKNVSEQEAEEIMDRCRMVNMAKNGKNIHIRYLSDIKENAESVEPTLEDLYLYYFGEAGL